MHPGFYYWWKGRHGHDCGGGDQAEGDWGPGWGEGRGGWGRERGWGRGGHHHGRGGEQQFGGFDGGGEFGVRRPLRFIAYKLELDEAQVGQLARILADLKTERAQAEVDQRRTTAAFADAVGGASFDEDRAAGGAQERVQSAERLKGAVVKALREIHGVLSEEQRAKLAYLIRTGVVTL